MYLDRLLIRLVLGLSILLLLSSTAAANENSLLCLERREKIFCRFSIRPFINKIEPILTNGWQNALEFTFLLEDEKKQVRAQSRITATQRCYIDPFESPCLLLWSGADNWISYEGSNELIAALSALRIQALELDNAEAGIYSVRLLIRINPITEKQVSDLQSWFKRSGHYRVLPFGSNDSSLLGSFLTAFAKFSSGDAEASLHLQTNAFFISIPQKSEIATPNSSIEQTP